MSSLQASSTSSGRGLGTTHQVIMGLFSAESLALSACGGDAEESADGAAGATGSGTSAAEQPTASDPATPEPYADLEWSEDAAPPLSAEQQACSDAEYELGDALLVEGIEIVESRFADDDRLVSDIEHSSESLTVIHDPESAYRQARDDARALVDEHCGGSKSVTYSDEDYSVDDVDFHVRDLTMLGEFSSLGREVTAEVGDLSLRYTMTLQQFEEDQMPDDATNEQIAQRLIAVLDHLESNA